MLCGLEVQQMSRHPCGGEAFVGAISVTNQWREGARKMTSLRLAHDTFTTGALHTCREVHSLVSCPEGRVDVLSRPK